MFDRHVVSALAALPSGCRPWSRGWCSALAGILEAAAAKPGNVHPTESFPDLSFADLTAAAVATVDAMDRARHRPLGQTILAAVRASRAATSSNANLGIILLVAPLAAAEGPMTPAAVETALERLGPADATAVWEAIAVARPGGLGESAAWDLAGPPPEDIREAMRHAAGRDSIARLWAEGYAPLFAGPVADLAAAIGAGAALEDAVIETHLRQLAREPDSLIARRHGLAAAEDVARRARVLIAGRRADEWPADLASFDGFLRRPRRLNPGTTADLVAAAIYILLRDGRLRAALPLPTPLPPDPDAA